MNIEYLNNEFKKIWIESSNQFPVFTEVVLNDKLQRENEVIAFSKKMENNIDFGSLTVVEREIFINKFKHNFSYYFQNLLSFSEGEALLVSNDDMINVTTQFMQMAREFDSNVNVEDVFQAGRNLWIINSLQIMMGAPIKLSKSVFAYSMLYPYSDNYLDDPEISSSEKIAFSKRFGQRLKGEYVIPANNHERAIFDLVGLIEEDWNRANYPEVYQSLLAIHEAQTKSIDLVSRKDELTYDDLLMICIEKGGTSVLADGYLINGTLTPEQEKFCYGFGAFLQFVDDIQDIEEDSRGELQTAFTYAASGCKLDEMVNKSIDFGVKVMSNLSCFDNESLPYMSSLMIKSNLHLLTEAIAINEQFYEKEYVNNFERYSVFRFEFIRKRRKKMETNRTSMMSKLSPFVFGEQQEQAMQA